MARWRQGVQAQMYVARSGTAIVKGLVFEANVWLEGEREQGVGSLQVMVDTGANVNVLALSWVEARQWRGLLRRSWVVTSVRGFGPGRLAVVGVCKLGVEMKDWEGVVDVIVVDYDATKVAELVLGLEWMQEQRVSINWRPSGFQLTSGDGEWEGNMDAEGLEAWVRVVRGGSGDGSDDEPIAGSELQRADGQRRRSWYLKVPWQGQWGVVHGDRRELVARGQQQ